MVSLHPSSGILLVSHDPATVEEHCDRVAWIEHGSIAARGPTSEVLPRYCEGPGREELRERVKFFLTEDTPPEGFLISIYPGKWWLQGKTLAEIAAERGEDPAEVVIDLACSWWSGTGIYCVDVKKGKLLWHDKMASTKTSKFLVGKRLENVYTGSRQER